MKYNKLKQEIESGEYNISILMPSFCTAEGKYLPVSYFLAPEDAMTLINGVYDHAIVNASDEDIEFKVSFSGDTIYLHTNNPVTH